MKKAVGKEIIFAIISGLLIAFIITFIIYFKNYHEKNEIAPSQPTPTPITSLPEKTTKPLTITFPENEAVYEDRSLTLTGQTLPQTPVVIFLNQKDFFTQSDENGNFAFELNLESGSNHLMAIAVNELGENLTDEIIVIHTNKSLEEKLLSEDEIMATDDET